MLSHLASYHVDDYVLVNRSHWPQRKLKKIESQWFGPFRVLEVRHNVVKVARSPSLGGEALVTSDMLKHWKSVLDYESLGKGGGGSRPPNVVH